MNRLTTPSPAITLPMTASMYDLTGINAANCHLVPYVNDRPQARLESNLLTYSRARGIG